MSAKHSVPRSRDAFGGDDLVFVPLGGSGEIGMNLNLYGLDGRWLMVDCGITFDNSSGRTKIQMPDPGFIAARRDRLDGLVITHVHEDHVGAVAHLWPQLRCPVYCTPFCAEILMRKLGEADLAGRVPVHVMDQGSRFPIGPFEIELVGITHSTVEACCAAIRTRHGTILHTGDWKLDPDPLVGPPTDERRLRAIGEEGVLAVVGDSTNATKEGVSGSEGELREHLRRLCSRFDRRLATACFASNVARVQTLVEIADELGRHPVILGRSMIRNIGAAQRTGYLERIHGRVDPRDMGYLPPERVMLICTGTQGEPGAALSRISTQDHRDAYLERGDGVVFSSKIIPGNEVAIERLHARLRRLGAEVVCEHEELVHVSGHPCREELRTMYGWLQPRILVPVHGEQRHMEAHADLGHELGIPEVVVPRDGTVVHLAPGPARIVASVPVGRLELGGERGRSSLRSVRAS